MSLAAASHAVAGVPAVEYSVAPEAGAPARFGGFALRVADEGAVPAAVGTEPSAPPLVRRRAGTEAERVFRELAATLTGDPSSLPPLTVAEQPAARGAAGAARLPEELPSVDGLGVDMVIVTTAEMEAAFQPLADWKTAKGVVTVVRTTDWIDANYPNGQDTPERIRAFLRDAYAKWGLYLVLLAGDYEEVPPRVVDRSGNRVPTDQYYACLDGTWNADGDSLFAGGLDDTDVHPDVFVGRAPVETPAEAAAFVDKSIRYDTAPRPGYVEDFCQFAEVLFPHDWACGQDSSAINLDGKVYAESLAALAPPEWTRTMRAQSDCDLDRSIALAELGAGHHVVSFLGHGDAFRFSVGDGVAPFVLAADAETLSNGDALSFVVSVACSPNQFDAECVGEAFLNNPGGGAIAVSASTREDYPQSALSVRQSLFRTLFRQDETRFGVSDQIHRLPFSTAPFNSTARWQWLTGILFGDPELRLWRNEPEALAVSHAASVTVADASLAVTVTGAGAAPVADALVCVSGGNGTYARGRTDAAGAVTLPLAEDAPGTLRIVVTKREHLPHDGTIPVLAAAAPRLLAGAVVIDDDATAPSSGNGDGVIDAGETVRLLWDVTNASAAAVPGVVATPSVEAGGSATFDLRVDGVADPSLVFVGASRAHPATVPFTLNFAFPALDYEGAPHHVFAADSVGADRGVFLWQDHEGWHLRWSVGRDSLAVTGTVTTGGRVRSLDAPLLESGTDAAAVGGGGSSFTFTGWTHATDREDGVDFALADDTMLTVLSAPDALGTIGAGATVTAEAVVTVSPSARAGQIAALDLGLTASAGGPWTGETPVVFAGPRLLVHGGVIDDSGTPPTSGNGNGVAEIGETVRWTPAVFNRGTGAAPAVNGALSAPLDVTVIDAADAYGEIASGAEDSGADGYVFSLDGPGATFVILTLTDAVGRVTVHAADLLPPAPPQGLAAESTEDTITLTWTANAESDLAGYRVYRSDTPGTGYALASSPEPLRGGARFVDERLPLHSTYWYRVAAVDSSGNESLPSAEWKAWTVQAQLAGWPQTAGGNVFSSPGVADLDRDGAAEVFVGGIDTRMHGWNPDGSLLVGFPAETDAEIWSTPAFGDLDRDGKLDVVWGSRDAYLYAARPDGTPVVGASLRFAPLQSEIRGTASLVDVDGDGSLEIFVGNDTGRVWAFRADGSGLTSPNGLFFTCPPGNSTALVWGTIAAADLAGDGQVRLAFASWNDSVYVADAGGNVLPGFPRAGLDDFRAGVTLGDLDADGTMEIVAGDVAGNVWVFDHDGGDYAFTTGGLLATLPGSIRGSVALANVDADPELEILLGALDGNLYAFQHDGTGLLQPGGLFAALDPTEGVSAQPIVVDVDGDGDFEIFVGHRSGTFYGLHHDGSVLAGFPFPTDLDIFATAAAGDVDGDGDIEIAFASYDQFVRVLDFDGPAVPEAFEWPTYAGNGYRTGAYVPGGHGPVGAPVVPAAALPFALGAGTPNPFRGNVSIAFSLPRDGVVRLQVFDAAGRLVRTLRDGALPAGRYDVTWDGRDARGRAAASGVYFYRLASDEGERTRKLVRLR